jgi:hypothetical protein
VQTRAVAARFLNFEGAQRAKLQDQASWSGSNRGRASPNNVPCHQGQDDEVSNPIPNEEEQELMHGVTRMDMQEPKMSSVLPPVYGPDGVQQRVSFGTNIGSEEEDSTGMSCPPDSLMKRTDYEKSSGPDRGGEKNKRNRSSPYKRTKRPIRDTLKTTSEIEDARLTMKKEDQAMKEDGFGGQTLALFPTEPKPLTGPHLEARQEP